MSASQEAWSGRGTRLPGDRSQFSQDPGDPGPAATRITGGGPGSDRRSLSRHRHGRLHPRQKYAANNFHNLSQNFLTLINPLMF